jgi:T5orf172 domain
MTVAAPSIKELQNAPAVLGLVYFLMADSVNLIKIGHTSRKLHKRIAAILGASPVPLRGLGVIRGEVEVEQALHEKFSAHRAHYEWFNAHEELLAFIKEIAAPWPSRTDTMVTVLKTTKYQRDVISGHTRNLVKEWIRLPENGDRQSVIDWSYREPTGNKPWYEGLLDQISDYRKEIPAPHWMEGYSGPTLDELSAMYMRAVPGYVGPGSLGGRFSATDKYRAEKRAAKSKVKNSP